MNDLAHSWPSGLVGCLRAFVYSVVSQFERFVGGRRSRKLQALTVCVYSPATSIFTDRPEQ